MPEEHELDSEEPNRGFRGEICRKKLDEWLARLDLRRLAFVAKWR